MFAKWQLAHRAPAPITPRSTCSHTSVITRQSLTFDILKGTFTQIVSIFFMLAPIFRHKSKTDVLHLQQQRKAYEKFPQDEVSHRWCPVTGVEFSVHVRMCM